MDLHIREIKVLPRLRERIERALRDAELPRLCAGLGAVVRFNVARATLDIVISPAGFRVEASEVPDLEIAASEEAWEKVLEVPPPPRFHSFTALQMANPEFRVEGDPQVVAQCRPALERIIEMVTSSPLLEGLAVVRDLSQIEGFYRKVRIDSHDHDLFIERSGRGIPVLLLHPAGSDSRMFQAQLADSGLAARYCMWGVDLPFHGRSLPPLDWAGGSYRLDTETAIAWCVAVLEQVIGEKAVIAGGSMGAAMALVLAARRPDLVRGVVAIEPPLRSPGRRNPFQHHAHVHGQLHNGSYVRGLLSPVSPEAGRRRAAWIYSQGAPGVYPGDLVFYSEEFDGMVTGPQIDAARTPVALLSGTYDFSATPDDGRKLAALIPGASHVVMEGLGHFPMTENPDLFRPYFADALRLVSKPVAAGVAQAGARVPGGYP